MSGSRHFAEAARKIVYKSDRGAKAREERWKARCLMEQQQKKQEQEEQEKQQQEQLKNLALEMGFLQDREDQKKPDDTEKKPQIRDQNEMACACGERCRFSVVLANLSSAVDGLRRVRAASRMLHRSVRRSERRNCEARVKSYWRTFVLNAKPSEPHNHAERLWRLTELEREEHLAEKARLPVDPVAPLRRPILATLLDPFGYVKCRCVHCAYLDAVMDYRVALFGLLTEYCELFEDYARLVWSSIQRRRPRSDLYTTAVDRQMFKLTMSELYTAMSFEGETENVMKGLELMNKLIYR
uniref:Pre-mRNA-splicing factor 38 n=1 Tax=Macrostomum lignano TaxID=282301 RepID=A0A1I8J996_9PLAT